MKATFLRQHQETQNIITFWFKPEKTIDFTPGQFIDITIPHENPDDREQRRWFSLSSSPTDIPEISITTKFADKPSSLKRALRSLKPGAEVSFIGPQGEFVLPKDETAPVTFIAGGIGITPFHSIIKWLYDTKQKRNINFIYAARSQNELIFQDLFEKYDMKRTIILSEPEGNWDGEIGKLTPEQVLKIAPANPRGYIYISGPEPLVEILNDGLIELGIKESQLVTDYFGGYTHI